MKYWYFAWIHGVPRKMYISMEISWGIKPGPLVCRIAQQWYQPTSLSPPSTAVINARVWLTKTTPRRSSTWSSRSLIAASTELGRTIWLTSRLERHVTASFISTLTYSGHGHASTALIISCIVKPSPDSIQPLPYLQVNSWYFDLLNWNKTVKTAPR